MAKLKHAKPAVNSPQELRERINRCINERRFQTALDLAKQLNKYEPTTEHRDLLVRCYFGRAKQLRDQGSTRDAATVLDAAVPYIGNDPAQLVKVAEELAAAGEIPKALQLVARLPEPKPPNRVLPLAADIAIQRGANGSGLLPEPMRVDFDRVRQAFSHLEKGQDEAAKEVMQGIGLSSPFLEWKLFLRGLQAYYLNDDARAIDNWSRLDSTRFPARLAAPLRWPIDPAFRSAQSPEAQERVTKQSEKLTGNPLAGRLRDLRRLLHGSNNLFAALRELQSVMPALKQQRPDLVHRLAEIVYWEIVDHGTPNDIQRYRDTFGRPVDDPEFSRMNALALEGESAYGPANQEWQRYGEFLEHHPQLGPAEHQRARAMVWFRMALNARRQADLVHATQELFRLPFGPVDRPKLLKPGVEECLQKSIALAPDWLEPSFALFDELQHQNKPAQAAAAGHKLLERFPQHLPTLENLAELERKRGKIEAAEKLMERAFEADPLNRELRRQFGRTRRLLGMRLVEQGKFDSARAAFRSALELVDPIDDLMPLCGWAACEFLAGNDAKAEELLNQANAREDNRLAIAGYMAALAAHFKLAKPIKSRFDKKWKESLAADPTPGQAAALALLFSRYKVDGFIYHGGKSHEKKMLALVGKAASKTFTEKEMERLGMALSTLRAERLLRKFAAKWKLDFPTNPYPILFDIDTYLWKDDSRWPLWRLKPMAEEAKRLAEAMPAGSDRDFLLGRAEAMLQQFHDLNPFASLFDQFASDFMDDEGEADDWEDDDTW